MTKIRTDQKGFSLVELLVVVIIIAIVAAIAIPSLLASRRAANEASAISSLRSIHSSQATYFGTTGGNSSYAADLAALNADGLIDSALAGATTALTAKSGYYYGASVTATADGYCTTATPSSTGITGTGRRIFAVSSPGVIYQSTPTGTTPPTCATGALTVPAGAVPIQ
jgi:prepilin-type N-terminal cleavage/methylation domain-containing protein